MYYKYIYIAITLALMPMMANAAYNNVSLDVDTVLTVGSYNLTVSGSAAAVESIAVSDTSFTVVLPGGSSLVVKSATKQDMTTSGMNAGTAVVQCSGTSYSTLTLSAPAGNQTQTVVVTPLSALCNSGGSSVSSGSINTGSVSSGVSPVVTTRTVTPTVTVTPSLATPAISQVTGLSVSFATDLSKGITNPDVSRLQTLLASDKTLYPEGLVTGYFGPATESAVKRFQAKYGIDQVGMVGPATRAKLAQVYGTASVAPATPAIPNTTPAVPAAVGASSATFTTSMGLGATGNDVKRLQQILNSDKDTQVASSGIGSSGNETTSYGPMTQVAVQKFQVKYKIAKEGDAGYGIVGPMTRSMLKEVFGAR